jgi:hypothetical protein
MKTTLDYVRLWKVCAVDNPDYKAADTATYPAGTFNFAEQSLPVGYFLEGWLIRRPAVGGHVEVLRVMRNGVACMGYFTSSTVTELEPDGFRTKNSIYNLTVIPLSHDE